MPRRVPLVEITGVLHPPEGTSRVLSPLSVAKLRRVQLGPSTDRTGFVRIPSLAYTDIDHGYDVLDVPAEWDSPQLLEFCGLTVDAAATCFAEWEARNARGGREGKPCDSPVDEGLVDVAMEFLTARYEHQDPNSTGEDWERCLMWLGLEEDVTRAIMDPRFDRMRTLGDPLHWAQDTIVNNYEFLLTLDDMIAARFPTLKRIRHCMYGERATPRKEKPRAAATAALEAGWKKGCGTPRVYYLPAPASAVHDVFGRGLPALPGFMCAAKSEFHPTFQHYIHLLEDKGLAVEMSSYIATRSRAKQACILKAVVPDAVIQEAKEGSPLERDWQGLVWFSRNKKAKTKYGARLPRSLARYEHMAFFEAPVCGLSEERVTALGSHRDIRPLTLRDGSPAMQLVFQNGNSRGMWYDTVAETVHFDWVCDVASAVSQTLIHDGDIGAKEWEVKKMDCWNGWRWNEKPAMDWW